MRAARLHEVFDPLRVRVRRHVRHDRGAQLRTLELAGHTPHDRFRDRRLGLCHRHAHRLGPPGRAQRGDLDVDVVEGGDTEEVARHRRGAAKRSVQTRGTQHDGGEVAPARTPDLPIGGEPSSIAPVTSGDLRVGPEISHGCDATRLDVRYRGFSYDAPMSERSQR